jgi:tetratricopeptide (TPR) repeat protein
LADKNDDALKQLKSSAARDSTFELTHYWMGVAFEQQQRPAEAIPCLRRALALSPGSPIVLAALARSFATAGQADSAWSIVNGLLERENTGAYIPSYDLAKVYLSLGDKASAIARLQRAFSDRAHSISLMRVDPQLRALDDDPRFRSLLKRVEQPEAD